MTAVTVVLGCLLGKLLDNFWDVNMYVSADVQERDSCQHLIAHSAPQGCLDLLESTEGPLG